MTSAIFQPDYTAALGLITHLNNDELKELLNDDEKFENLIKDCSQIKRLESEKEMLMVQIKSLAEINLTKEPQLAEAKQRLKETSEKGEELSKLVDQKMQEIKSKNGDMSAETALALLQTAAAEMEEESEKIASKFLDGSYETEEFLTRFAEMRKLMHLRKVKADKMIELLSRKPLINHVPNYINVPPVTINTNYFPNNPITANNPAPYPAYPNIGMPLPNTYFPNNF